MKTAIEIPNGWDPRPHQLPMWQALEGGIKRAIAVWHRRAGKDSTSLNWAAASAVDRIGTYWHMAPTHRQVRKIVWNGIDKSGRRMIDQAFPKALRRRTNDQEMLIELKTGSIWQCVGSDNYDSLVGANPLGVVFSEWSLANPAAWDYVRPILVENGGWAIFIYTPRGRNHGLSLLEMAREDPDNWFTQVLSVDQTGVVPLPEIDRERRELTRQYGKEDADSIVDQEWFCSFTAALRGAYYAREMAKAEDEGRVGDFPHVPEALVYTAWDLGIGDAMAIWFFQVIGGEVRIIDFLQMSGQGLVWYVNRLLGVTRFDDEGNERDRREWAPIEGHEHRQAYQYDEDLNAYLPHDANVSELGTGKRRVDKLASMGVKGLVLPRISIDDGIQEVRRILPRCWFNRARCLDGINALVSYMKEWDDNLQAFKDKPLHNWASHPSDSFRYLAIGLRQEPPEEKKPPPPPVFSEAWHEARARMDEDEEEERLEYLR